MLKLFVMQFLWRGGIVVVASTEEEARLIMKEEYPEEYDNKYHVIQHDITHGVCIRIHGDD